MEVHHQPHIERKRLKHYLFEFLMLFLAVTLGFFVENQREHLVEKKRATQYMRSLLLDLKSDIAQFQDDQIWRNLRYGIMDSVIMLMQRPDRQEYTSQLYFLANWVMRKSTFIYNDRTIQQLKNSGSLRLIVNTDVSDSIMDYDLYARYIEALDREEYDLNQTYLSLERKIFNGYVMQDMVADTSLHHRPNNNLPDWEAYIIPPKGNPPLITTDAHLINEFIAHIQFMKSCALGNSHAQMSHIQRMRNLIELIKKEYHFE